MIYWYDLDRYEECTNLLSKNASSSLPSYNKLKFDQQRLAELMARDNDIRKKLFSIQFRLLPHLKIIYREISITHNLMKKYSHRSTVESLIDLAA